MHRVVTTAAGLVSVAGGKITGYRAIAAQVTDVVCRHLGTPRTAPTACAALPGATDGSDPDGRLERIYGTRAALVRDLVDDDRALGTTLVQGRPEIAAEVVFSARHEWCVHLEDFMLRRSYLGFATDRGLQAATPASRWMQRELGWSEEHRRQELHAYQTRVRRDLLEPDFDCENTNVSGAASRT